jgi:nitroreductase
MNVSDAIRMKRAVREYSPKPIPPEVIFAIVNAGRRAQSSKNTQPWHFIAITDKTILKQLSECGDWAGHLAGAALGVVIIHPDPQERFQILFDAGQAAAYMQLAALELGVGSCLATLYQLAPARTILNLPEDLYLRFAISFGYPAIASVLHNTPKKGGRRDLSDLVFSDQWGKLATFLPTSRKQE